MESRRGERKEDSKGDSKKSTDSSRQKIPDYLLDCEAKWDHPLTDLIEDFLKGDGNVMELLMERATYNNDDWQVFKKKIKEIGEKKNRSAQECVLLGSFFLDKGDYAAAKIALQDALKLDKKNACALTRLGCVYYFDTPQDLARARECSKDARELKDPFAFSFSRLLIEDSKEKKEVLLEGAKLNSFHCERSLFTLSDQNEIKHAHKAISLGSFRACIDTLSALYRQKNQEEIISPLANFIKEKITSPYPYPLELMRIHREGFGVPVDLTRAAYLCRLSLKCYLAQKQPNHDKTLKDLRWFLESLMLVPNHKPGGAPLRPGQILEAKHLTFPGAIYHSTLAFFELGKLDRYPKLSEDFRKLALERPIEFDTWSAEDSLDLIKPLLDAETFAIVEKRRSLHKQKELDLSQFKEKEFDLLNQIGLPPPLTRIIQGYVGEDPMAQLDERLLAVSNQLATMQDKEPVQKIMQDLLSFCNTGNKKHIKDAIDYIDDFQTGKKPKRTFFGADRDRASTPQIKALFDQVKTELQQLKEAMDKHEAKHSRGDRKGP